MVVSLLHSKKLVFGVPYFISAVFGNVDRGISDIYIYQALSTHCHVLRGTIVCNISGPWMFWLGWWQ